MEKGIIGKPKYNIGNRLYSVIKTNDGLKYISGRVFVVDSWGTFEQNEEPSYDLIGVIDNKPVTIGPLNELHDDSNVIIFKHIKESAVVKSQKAAYDLLRDILNQEVNISK